MSGVEALFFSLLNKHGRYKIGGKSFKYNQLMNTTTTTLALENGKTYYTKISGTSSIQVGSGSSISVSSGDIVINLTDLQLDTITTLEQFYATDLGKEIKKGFVPPYSPTNAIYEADLSEATFKYEVNNVVSLLGKQNADISKSGTTSPIASFVDKKFAIGSWATTPKIKNVNVFQNHKYAFITLWNKVQTRTYFGNLYFTITNRQQVTNLSGYQSNNTIVVVGTYPSDESGDLSIQYGYTSPEWDSSLDDIKGYALIDLTDLGLDNLTAQQFYDQYHDKFEQLANGETVFKPQTVSILQNGQPLKIDGIGTAKDYYSNASGKVNRAIGNVDLGTLSWSYQESSLRFVCYNTPAHKISLNALCSKYQVVLSWNDNLDKIIWFTNNGYFYIKDTDYTDATSFKNSLSGQILHYELATPTTEQANSVMLRKGYTKCYDKNNLELDLEIIDPLNFSNKTLQGKNAPTITAEKIITKGFTSGDEHFTQLYIYEDGEIWYVNSQGSAQAYVDGIGWEIEYKTIQFDSGVRLTEDERNALLSIYDLI